MCPAYSPVVVEDLELQLKQSLRKVEPNPEFVNHLQDRLTNPTQMSVERRQSIGFGLLLIAGSIMSGMLLLLLVRLLRPAAN
ncbi:MAG: hypothetical protein IH586_04370 [Anaerolineaceae bacterium]|nr:hypothetical protein [Anaerolineaceae bacterium]